MYVFQISFPIFDHLPLRVKSALLLNNAKITTSLLSIGYGVVWVFESAFLKNLYDLRCQYCFFPEFIKQLTWITFRLSGFYPWLSFYFSAKFAFMICFQTPWSHSGASRSRPPLPSPSLQGSEHSGSKRHRRRHPAAEADHTLTLPFIHSFVHSSIIFWACGYQVLGLGTMWDILWPHPVSSFVKGGNDKAVGRIRDKACKAPSRMPGTQQQCSETAARATPNSASPTP